MRRTMETPFRRVSRLSILTVLPVFIGLAIYLNLDQRPFDFDGPFPAVKAMLWVVCAVFTGYSGYCIQREDIFATIREITRLHFGRQICLDLYLGVGAFLLLVYADQPSIGGFLFWMVPALFYLNIVTLLYLAIHFDGLVARLVPAVV